MNYLINIPSANPSVDNFKRAVANMSENSASNIAKEASEFREAIANAPNYVQDYLDRTKAGSSWIGRQMAEYDYYINDKLYNAFSMGQKMTNPVEDSKDKISSYVDEVDKALSGALRDENNQLFKDYFDSQIYHQIQGAEKAMQFEADQAKISRDWSEMMSNTAYQRAVADMKKAGLNPMLLVAKGFSPASTPNSASAKGFNVSSVSADVDTNSYAQQTIAKVLNSASEMLGTIGKVVQLFIRK